MGRGEVVPLKGHYVVRLCPFAVRLPRVHRIFAIFTRNAHGFCVRPSPLSCALYHEVCVFEHSLVILFENTLIAVLLIHIQRDIHARARPADRAVHHPHEPVLIGKRSNLRQSAALPLPVKDVAHVLARKRRIINHIRGSIKEYLAVTRPAHALARGTVGGEIGRVAL